MFERRLSLQSNSSRPGSSTPTKMKEDPKDDSSSPSSPGVSRYGRSHKPKIQDDFVSTDKKVGAYLKLSPGNQLQNYSTKREYKKKNSPKKVNSDSEGTPRRGRPPKQPKFVSAEKVDVSKVKVEPQDPSEVVDGCEYMVGDLAWGRVGGHPFWPCIIALDPIQNIFTKNIRKGRTSVPQRWVHVQFFGDNGRRSWLNITTVMSYNGRDAFVQLGETILAGMRKKEPKQTAAFVIKPAVIQVWEKAVQEAEDLITAPREKRVEFFSKYLPPPIVPLTTEEVLEQFELAESTPLPKKRGRKRKIVHTPSEEESKTKQPKLESVTAVKEEEKVDPLSTTPRTIADRKKRQALLMQMARTSQTPTVTCESSSADPPSPVGTSATKPEVQTPTSVKPIPLKRTITAETTESVEKKKPKKKYVKKQKDSADFQVYSGIHFDRVSDDHPELNVKDVNKYLLKMWNEMDDTQKSKYKSRQLGPGKEEVESAGEMSDSVLGSVEDVDEVVSSKSSSPSPIAVASQKTITAKRNHIKNLFSGAKAEKVCLHCEKAGDTVRCRGPCHSFYHPSCDTHPPPHPDKPAAVKRVYKKYRKRNHKSGGEEYLKEHSCSKEALPEPKKNVSEKTVKSEDSTAVSEAEKDQLKENGVAEVDDNVETKSPEPEPEVVVVEPKTRKGSKDSDSGSGEEGEGFRCKLCQEGRSQPCFVCHEYVDQGTGEAKLYRCVTSYCGKVYHEECLKRWPQSSWRTNGNSKGPSERGNMSCPQHTCHTCASDNPGVIKTRFSNDKLVRCIRCPVTYHYGSFCLPAGCEILSNSQIICPQHSKTSKKVLTHVNAAWCFICASGGSLICCDRCPTAFHADCLNISTPPDGSYVCEDCQTGRFPLYGEIVWVKLGNYRWWPAEIIYPALIPDNILNLPHVRGDFAVRFFGSNDYYWVNRGRVFLHQDGDSTGKTAYKKSSMDQTFERAVKEANEAQRKYLEEKAARDAEARPGMKIPNYVKLKTNKPVGSVRTVEVNLSSLTPCECDPKKDNPCAPDSDCLNRILMVECHPQVCPAGEKCCNQLFEKRLYPPLQPYNSQTRGWGLKTMVPLKKGDFVIEYVGEIINEEEYKKRLNQMHVNNEENFYFLTIDKDRMLDAGPKGNVARFMNHSCQPNCETQKWTVNGDTRVGLFALHDIPADTELVFNYNLESIGDKKPCMCGASNCSGFIGVKVTKNPEKETEGKEKKVVKKKKSLVVNKAHEDDCFVCGEDGQLLLCDGKHCTKGYHLTCLNKKQRPQGYWLCPWHQCNVCNKGRVQRCSFCVNSYCQEHADGNIRLDQSKGLVCRKHDPENSLPDEKPPTDKETAKQETSTVPEPMEVDNDSNEIPSTTSSNTSEISALKVEPINNNVVKSSNTPLRQTRRSLSNTDIAVGNDSAGKVSKRRGRPSSVDDKLIISLETTATSSTKQVETRCKLSSEKDVLLEQVTDTLPVKDALETIGEDEMLDVNSKEQTRTSNNEDQVLETKGEDQASDNICKEQASEAISKDEKSRVICEEQVSETISKDEESKIICKELLSDTISKDEESKVTCEEQASNTISQDQPSETVSKDEASDTVSQDKASDTISQDEAVSDTVSQGEASDTVSQDEASETISEEQASDTTISEDHTPKSTLEDLQTNIEDQMSKTFGEEVNKSSDDGSSSVVSSAINKVDEETDSLESKEKEDRLEDRIIILDNVKISIDDRESSSDEKVKNTHNYKDDAKISKKEENEDSNKLLNSKNKSPIVENESTGTVEPLVTSNDDKENKKNEKEPKTDEKEKTEPQTEFIEREKTLQAVNCLSKEDGDSKRLILAVDPKENVSESNNTPLEEFSKTASSNIVNILDSKCDEDLVQKPAENTLVICELNGPKSELLTSTQVSEDDFELSFSECSNGNVSKDVSNTESSIELKLTDYTTSKPEEVTTKSDELKSDLTNGIEQQSATEVA